MLGGHVRAVFTLVTFIFIGCVAVTLDSFREIPLWRLESVSQSAALNDENADVKVESTEQSALNDSLQPHDPINRTASYGALSNEQHLDIPRPVIFHEVFHVKKHDLYETLKLLFPMLFPLGKSTKIHYANASKCRIN